MAPYAGLAPDKSLAGDMPAEYSDALLKNMQLAGKNVAAAGRKRVLDNTQRFGPGMSGAQLGAMEDMNRGSADTTLGNTMAAQTEGVQQGMVDRRAGETRDFTASQAALDRAARLNEFNANLGNTKDEFGVNRSDSERNRMWQLMSMGGGALVGGALGGPAGALTGAQMGSRIR
jgi:hypothetical protein